MKKINWYTKYKHWFHEEIHYAYREKSAWTGYKDVCRICKIEEVKRKRQTNSVIRSILKTWAKYGIEGK